MFKAVRLCLIAGIVFFFCWGAALLQGEPLPAASVTPVPEASVPPAPEAVSPPVSLALTDLISLDYTEANLSTVLKSIAYSYNLNLVISKNIVGKVSVRLKDVTLDDALNALLTLNKYAFYRVDKLIYIVSKDEMELFTKSFQLNYMYAKDTKDFVSKLLSKRGDIQINASTNSLLVMDYPEVLVKVEELLKVVDQAPFQVLIEAKIVDIRTSDVEKIGTAWNWPTDSDPETAVKNISTGSVAKDDNGAMIKFVPRFKSFSANLSIDALLEKTDAHVLAPPSIATLSGLEARIIIGDRIPYKSSTNTISAGTGGTTTNSTVEFAEVGTTLKVTPLVSADGWITMKVHPEVSSVVMMIEDAGPQITTREADATIRVKDNETIIIGGLMGRNEDHTNNGVPGLSTLPGLGWLFKRHVSTNGQSELVVFITPHIIRTPSETPADLKINSVPEVRVDAQSLEKPVEARPSGKAVDAQSSVEKDVDGVFLGKDLDTLPSQKGVDVLSGLYRYVEFLEKKVTQNPTNSMYFETELIKTYKTIFQQFPQSGRGDFYLYKISLMYVKKFGKCAAAQEALIEMQNRYPDSKYLDETKSYVNACTFNAALEEAAR